MAVMARPSRLQADNVRLTQVMQATADTVDSGLLRFSTGAVIGTGGNIETPNQRISVRNVLPVVTPADLAEAPVPTRAAGPCRWGTSRPWACGTSR